MEFDISFADRGSMGAIIAERLRGLSREDGGQLTVFDTRGCEVSPNMLEELGSDSFPLRVRHERKALQVPAQSSVHPVHPNVTTAIPQGTSPSGPSSLASVLTLVAYGSSYAGMLQ